MLRTALEAAAKDFFEEDEKEIPAKAALAITARIGENGSVKAAPIRLNHKLDV